MQLVSLGVFAKELTIGEDTVVWETYVGNPHSVEKVHENLINLIDKVYDIADPVEKVEK